MAPQVLKRPILQGRVRRARMERPCRKQARALWVKEVVFLEDYLENECNLLLDRYAAGSFLFAVHSRARLGDLKEVCEVILDFLPSGEGFIQMVSLSHKSRRFTLATGLRMFLVAPTKGLSKSLWGVTC